MTLSCPLCESDEPPEIGPHDEHYCSACRSLIAVTHGRLSRLGFRTLVAAVYHRIDIASDVDGSPDAIGLLELIMELEDEVGFTIPDSDYDKILTPGGAQWNSLGKCAPSTRREERKPNS